MINLTRYGFEVAGRAPQAEVKLDENSLCAALVNAGFKATVIGKGRVDIAARAGHSPLRSLTAISARLGQM